MKINLVSLACTVIVSLLAGSTSHASECRFSSRDTTLSLPQATQFVINSNAVKYSFLQSEDDLSRGGASGVSPVLRAKRLRGAATVFFVITGFPFLPAGIALSTGGDVDARTVGGILTGLSTSFLIYGILMFIHADTLEKGSGGYARSVLASGAQYHPW